jgi:hypothetical protein
MKSLQHFLHKIPCKTHNQKKKFKQFEFSGNTTQLDQTFGDSKYLLTCKTNRKFKYRQQYPQVKFT